jgi:hypothetical protein
MDAILTRQKRGEHLPVQTVAITFDVFVARVIVLLAIKLFVMSFKHCTNN